MKRPPISSIYQQRAAIEGIGLFGAVYEEPA
jgi:hypothetical protein